MLKLKTNDVKNIHGKKCGKKNNIPKEICNVIEKLEDLDFVNHISPGKVRNSNNGSGIKIIGYDDKMRNYHISVSVGKYEQRIMLNVPLRKPHYDTLISGCF